MDTTGNQSESEAVDQLFGESSPGPEAQGTSAEEQATTGTEGQAEGTESGGQQQAEAEQQVFAEVAGRKYSTKEDFIKSHETVLEKMRRLEQESKGWKAAHDRWSPWEKWLQANPEFDKQLRTAEQKYRASRASGASKTEARADAGMQNLPPEILKKIEAHDEFVRSQQQATAHSEFKAEMDALRSKYKLDEGTAKRVMETILHVATQTGLDIPAEEAYWRIQHETSSQTLAKKEAELQRVKSGDGPVTTTGAKAPKKRIDQMNDREFNAELAEQVNRLNLTD